MAKSAGFSLVEILVVMAILALLSAISFTGIQSVREASRRTVCLSQMGQVCLALQHFEASNGSLPPTIVVNRVHTNLHWQAMILPYVEQANLFDEVNSESLRFIYGHPHQLTTVPLFQCPSNPDQNLLILDKFDRSFAFTDYCGVAGVDIENSNLGIFPVSFLKLAHRVRLADVTDGLTNTLCFGERPPNPLGRGYGRWLGSQQTSLATIGVFEKYDPFPFNHDGSFTSCLNGPIGFRYGERGMPCSALHHWSYHPGGANFARVDGSVDLVPYSVDPDVLKALATRDGGEALTF